MNHLDRPNDDGSGGFCPNKGGDWGSYPSLPGGGGFPNEYEEITPQCDGFLLDIKLFANLDHPTWDDPLFQLQNAGAQEEPLVYLGEGNQYGTFVDPYLVENGITNPQTLDFTDIPNPDPKPLQKISVSYEAMGVASKYVDMETGEMMGGGGLTEEEFESRASKIAKSVN
uniref:Uncharacterized protein n=1 Tax=Grammatophora oceanica TaxID=210454 RepID=A0A7S1YJN6_9STRA